MVAAGQLSGRQAYGAQHRKGSDAEGLAGLERYVVREVLRETSQRCEGALVEVCAGEAPIVAGCPEGVGAGGGCVEVHAEPLC